MRSLQLVLRSLWDFQDDSMMIPWNRNCKRDLIWWTQDDRLRQGTSLEVILPDLSLWSDASDTGWGAHLGEKVASGLWGESEAKQSINWRELRAVHLALVSFTEELTGSSVALFVDNSTAVSYLKNQGGTFSRSLNAEAQTILRLAEKFQIVLLPQFILGSTNVVADALSSSDQIIGLE